MSIIRTLRRWYDYLRAYCPEFIPLSTSVTDTCYICGLPPQDHPVKTHTQWLATGQQYADQYCRLNGLPLVDLSKHTIKPQP